MKKLSIYLIGVLTVLTLTFQGCKKDSTTSGDAIDSESTEVSADNAQAEQNSTDGFDITNDALNTKGIGSNKTDGEVSAILNDGTIIKYSDPSDSTSPNKWPKTIVVTFKGTNPDGRECKDGRYRKGTMTIVLTKKFREKDAMATITYGDDFYVNGNKVEGEKVFTNLGIQSNGNLMWKVEVKKSKIRRDDGKTISWTSTRYHEEIREGNTRIGWLITGDASGITGNGVAFTIKITKAIRIEKGCRWPKSGKVEITPSGKSTRIIDYGNGSCDAIATVTINGKTYTINLRK